MVDIVREGYTIRDGAVLVTLGSGSTIPSPTITGQVLAPNGTAVAPSYSFSGDTDLGLYRSGADQLGVAASQVVLASNTTITSGGGNINLAPGGTTSFSLDASAQRWSVGASVGWSSNANAAAAAADTAFSRISAGVVGVGTGAAGSIAGTIQAANLSQAGANGQVLAAQSLSELTTIAAAASTDTTIQMPANAVILGVSVRVTTVIPTAATFTVGDSGSAARFSTAAVSTAANSTDPGTKAGAYYNASALAIRITPNASPADNTGRVRVTIHYYTVTPPTS